MKRADVRVHGRLLANLQHVLLDLELRLLDDLFNPSRVNAAVLNELGQRESGDFAANVVECADDHHAGGVVHDDIDAGTFFKRANIASLATDDPPFHVVAGNVDGADGGVGGVP